MAGHLHAGAYFKISFILTMIALWLQLQIHFSARHFNDNQRWKGKLKLKGEK
jgi:hypothetical protein